MNKCVCRMCECLYIGAVLKFSSEGPCERASITHPQPKNSRGDPEKMDIYQASPMCLCNMYDIIFSLMKN